MLAINCRRYTVPLGAYVEKIESETTTNERSCTLIFFITEFRPTSATNTADMSRVDMWEKVLSEKHELLNQPQLEKTLESSPTRAKEQEEQKHEEEQEEEEDEAKMPMFVYILAT